MWSTTDDGLNGGVTVVSQAVKFNDIAYLRDVLFFGCPIDYQNRDGVTATPVKKDAAEREHTVSTTPKALRCTCSHGLGCSL